MDLSQWQKELEAVLNDVQKIEARFQSSAEKEKRQVCVHVNRLLQEEQRLDYTVQHFRSYRQSESHISSRHKHLIHWLHEIAENSLELYHRTSHFLSQCSWLQACYSLLTKDVSSNHSALSQSQVLDMKKQYENLGKTRQVLAKRLQEIQGQKARLNAEYQAYNIEKANIEAAHCLQQEWGVTPANAQRHPVLRELQQLFHHIKLYSQQNPAAAHQFQALSQSFVDQSRGLMQQTKRMIEQNDRQTSARIRKKTLQSLQAKLQGIASLEKKLDKLSLCLVKNAPSRVPIRVKKNQCQGRTITRSHHLEHTS
ncbi:MAG: hypothetical protein ACOH5I_15905 [Oligoflexus sp.]